MSHTYNIVGMYYRPPAPALCDTLPVGTKIILRAEPENEHDRNAIAVYVQSLSIPESSHEVLEEKLAGFGFTVDEILASEAWQLGYIPKELAATLKANGFPENEDVLGKFCVSPRGKPQVTVEDGEE